MKIFYICAAILTGWCIFILYRVVKICDNEQNNEVENSMGRCWLYKWCNTKNLGTKEMHKLLFGTRACTVLNQVIDMYWLIFLNFL